MRKLTDTFFKNAYFPTKTVPILIGLPPLDAENDVVFVYEKGEFPTKPRLPKIFADTPKKVPLEILHHLFQMR